MEFSRGLGEDRRIGFSVWKQCMCGRGEICESRRQLVCRRLADYNRRGISSKPCLQRCLRSRDELTMKLLLLSTNGRSMDTVWRKTAASASFSVPSRWWSQ